MKTKTAFWILVGTNVVSLVAGQVAHRRHQKLLKAVFGLEKRRPDLFVGFE